MLQEEQKKSTLRLFGFIPSGLFFTWSVFELFTGDFFYFIILLIISLFGLLFAFPIFIKMNMQTIPILQVLSTFFLMIAILAISLFQDFSVTLELPQPQALLFAGAGAFGGILLIMIVGSLAS